MGIVGRRTASGIFYGLIGKITSTLIAFGGSVVLAGSSDLTTTGLPMH